MKKTLLLLMVSYLPFLTTHAQFKNLRIGVTTHSYHTEDGNVGIGTGPTAAPLEKLQVVGNVMATNFSSVNGTFSSRGTTDLILRTNTANRVYIRNSDGFVGIGITPTEMLHVGGNVLSNQYTATNGTFNSGGNLQLSTLGTNRMTILSSSGFVGIGTTPNEMLHVNGNILSVGDVSSSSFSAAQGLFNASGTSNLILSTNGTSRLNILGSSGFVGIGVNPTEMLHVNGNILSTGSITATKFTGNISANEFAATNATIQRATAVSLMTNGLLVSDNDAYASPSAGDLVVKGKVSIGTPLVNNPNNYTLAVNGKIGAKDIQVETKSTTWPDFVFSANYKLRSLKDVEKYINENHHLENVPSAEEIENEHNLGKMDAILLQKVEELTLYIIQQQKEIDELKKQIAAKQ